MAIIIIIYRLWLSCVFFLFLWGCPEAREVLVAAGARSAKIAYI